MIIKRHLYKSGKNYAIHTERVKEKKMDLNKQIDYISKGKDPYKEEFNRVAEALDKIYMSKTATDEQKLFAFNNIAESANGRPHSCGKVDDKSQLILEF